MTHATCLYAPVLTLLGGATRPTQAYDANHDFTALVCVCKAKRTTA